MVVLGVGLQFLDQSQGHALRRPFQHLLCAQATAVNQSPTLAETSIFQQLKL